MIIFAVLLALITLNLPDGKDNDPHYKYFKQLLTKFHTIGTQQVVVEKVNEWEENNSAYKSLT